ncbi:MAG TPA: cytochrome c oxidase assembly protein [Puia sp.]|nr:cytochrome c oxidase assembly protein [Puia sp.]
MRSLIVQWHFDPWAAVLAAVMIYGYYVLFGLRLQRAAYFFWLALLVFLLATCSPLHYVAMQGYLSAHMVAHILLLLICGPLLVFSLSDGETWLSSEKVELAEGAGSNRAMPWLRGVSAYLAGHSWVAWATGIGIMWVWHIPFLLNASRGVMHGWSLLSLIHTGSLLVAGIVFSWPLFGPFLKDRMHPMSGILYLGTACISCSLMGLLLAFAPPGIYGHYAGMAMSGTLRGLTAKQDMQASGLIMWVPCCLVYLTGCFVLVFRWLKETGQGHRRTVNVQ